MEELDIAGILTALRQYDLSPIERVLAAHTGTVQLLLSLWWGEEVVVDLIDNHMGEEDNTLRREAVLRLANSGTPVASALSSIDLIRNHPKIVEDISAGRLGIGQIAIKHGINTRRRIEEVSIKDECLYRRYIVEGPGVHYEIQEFFPRALYCHQ